MAVKHLKPTSAGRRFQTVSDFSEITCTTPEKSLLEPLPKKAGRNNNGRITTRHQGGGHKRQYRKIDFKRRKDDVPAKVATIEYDPNRSARIALLHYADGAKAYILCPEGLHVGDTRHLRREGHRHQAGQLHAALRVSRSARSSTPSSSSRARARPWPVPPAPPSSSWARTTATPSCACPPRSFAASVLTCRATIGEVGNAEHSNIVIGKAGRSRWAGVRPTVRGTVMNPVDHPHGGRRGQEPHLRPSVRDAVGQADEGLQDARPEEGLQPA